MKIQNYYHNNNTIYSINDYKNTIYSIEKLNKTTLLKSRKEEEILSGSINQDSKEGLEIYKGKIIGFTNTGMAAYSGEGARLCAVDTCELCGQVVDSHLSHADFCPICAVLLGLTTENFVREYCLERYQSQLDDLYNDFEYKRYMISLVDGFKLGIQFALKNASATLEHKIKFNYYND